MSRHQLEPTEGELVEGRVGVVAEVINAAMETAQRLHWVEVGRVGLMRDWRNVRRCLITRIALPVDGGKESMPFQFVDVATETLLGLTQQIVDEVDGFMTDVL